MATAGSPLKVYGSAEGQAAMTILVGHEHADRVVLFDKIAVLKDLAQPRGRATTPAKTTRTATGKGRRRSEEIESGTSATSGELAGCLA